MKSGAPTVAIIGAGMSGLCMAVKLQDADIDTFTIFEQADEVGGTWRDNTYPGLTCDIPSRYYSYSFRPNPEWSHLLPPGAEIQEYFRTVAAERGVRANIRFGTEVTGAEFRDGQWFVSTSAGTEPFDVLVTATGVLRIPKYPDLAGLDTFAGPTFHSARWDHSVSLSDKRIGVVGTGSTGVQITAALGGNVRQLKVFQRTAQWIYPMPNPGYRRSPAPRCAALRCSTRGGSGSGGCSSASSTAARQFDPGGSAASRKGCADGTSGCRCGTRRCGTS